MFSSTISKELSNTKKSINFDSSYPELYEGDIFAVEDSSRIASKVLSSLLYPKTRMYHFGLIENKAGIGIDEHNYTMLESVFIDLITRKIYWQNLKHNATSTALLSKYNGLHMWILRPTYSTVEFQQRRAGKIAVTECIRLSTAGYDIGYIPKAILRSIIRGLPPWEAENVKDYEDINKDSKRYNCVTLVLKSWHEAGFDIIEPGILPTPSAYKVAIDKRKIVKIFEGPANW